MVNQMDSPLWIDNGSGPIRNPALSDAEFAEGLESMKQSNTAALWEAAHNYEYFQVSGSAVGLLALGVAQSKPKCIAVMTWIQSIWTLYYQRKPLVTHEWDATLLDFSSCGQIPYTVPELIAEVLG